jgi:hypothetical protein
MMGLPQSLPTLTYPVLYWQPNFISLVRNPFQLCDCGSSGYSDAVHIAKSGKTRLFDAEGRYFHVIDLMRVKPFGNPIGIALRYLFREVVAVPVLSNETQLSLPEFKKKLAWAVRDRYRYDSDTTDGRFGIQAIKSAESYKAALEAVPGFPK